MGCVAQPAVYGAENPVLIGYMRVSKADRSQVLDLQRDALLAVGVTAEPLRGSRLRPAG